MSNNDRRGYRNVSTSLATDHRLDPWVWAIGKLIVNFSSVEFLSYMWIDNLSEGPDLHEKAIKQSFGDRVGVIKGLIEDTGVSAELKKEAIELWDAALSMAGVRNMVAHNPIGFHWDGEEGDRPPDRIAIPIMREVGGASGKEAPTITSLVKLNEAVDMIAELAQSIESMLDKILNTSSVEGGAIS